MDSLLEDPEGRTPLHLKAVNDACRSLRNQWTAATMFLRLNVRVCVCLCLRRTPVVLSVADLPFGNQDE